MNVLVLNGSPRGTGGATWWVANLFIKGMEEAGARIEVINLNTKKIHHCSGEMSCWLKTPGCCIHNDDMAEVIEAAKRAEHLVIATPVYFDGMTGLLKNCFDRFLSCSDPHMELRGGHVRHIGDVVKIKNVVLVSVCGFPEIDNFHPLVEHIKALARNMNACYAGAVLRPAGPMFPELPTINPMFFKVRSVTKAIEKAGREFVCDGKISEDTAELISQPIMSNEEYVKTCNKYFDGLLNKR